MPRAAVAESRIVALVVAGRESVVRNVDIVSGRDCGEGGGGEVGCEGVGGRRGC